MVGCPVKSNDGFQELALSLAQPTNSSINRVSQSANEISALSTIFASSLQRSIGMVLTTAALPSSPPASTRP